MKIRQQRLSIDASEEEILEQEVRDARAASPEERMAAAITLLDSVYELWKSRGMTDDPGLCRFPGCAQERRRLE